MHQRLETLTVTFNDRVLCLPVNDETAAILQSPVAKCQSEEADQRLIRHMINCLSDTAIRRTVIRTIDTDVLILAIAFTAEVIYLVQYDGEIFVQVVSAKSTSLYNAINVVKHYGKRICMALLFFLFVHRM